MTVHKTTHKTKGSSPSNMGGSVSKSGMRRKSSEKYVMNLKEKVRLLQEEIKEMMYEREKETRSYERDIMVFTFKEAIARGD